MKDLLLFSEKLKGLWNNLQFHLKKYWKMFVLLFKWNKNIKLLQLSYFREWRFEKSYLIIHFSFKNAIWYQLKNIKRINCLQPIILNLENIKEKQIEFTVYGFFRKKTYLIDVVKTETLITKTFKTEIKQINMIEQIASSILVKIKKPILEKQIILLEQNNIEANIKPITLNFKNYTQKEFI
jgi:hypothetical protein